MDTGRLAIIVSTVVSTQGRLKRTHCYFVVGRRRASIDIYEVAITRV
jgi:hypothetical protein